MVLPADSEVLLGAIPMEEMDLAIEPKTQTNQIRPDMPFISKKPIKSLRLPDIIGDCR